jgi:hypothetical protein
MPQFVIPHRIEFAFTRRVACTAGAPKPACVEIVLHATPDNAAVNNVLSDLGDASPNTRFVDYDTSTEARIVVDPATLLPYAHEEQIDWHPSISSLQSSIPVIRPSAVDPGLSHLSPATHR